MGRDANDADVYLIGPVSLDIKRQHLSVSHIRLNRNKRLTEKISKGGRTTPCPSSNPSPVPWNRQEVVSACHAKKREGVNVMGIDAATPCSDINFHTRYCCELKAFVNDMKNDPNRL